MAKKMGRPRKGEGLAPSGADWHRAQGLKPLTVGFTPEQHADLQAAAGILGMSMSALAARGAAAEAARVIEEFRKKPEKLP